MSNMRNRTLELLVLGTHWGLALGLGLGPDNKRSLRESPRRISRGSQREHLLGLKRDLQLHSKSINLVE